MKMLSSKPQVCSSELDMLFVMAERIEEQCAPPPCPRDSAKQLVLRPAACTRALRTCHLQSRGYSQVATIYNQEARVVGCSLWPPRGAPRSRASVSVHEAVGRWCWPACSSDKGFPLLG